jgi:hypothetical protein
VQAQSSTPSRVRAQTLFSAGREPLDFDLGEAVAIGDKVRWNNITCYSITSSGECKGMGGKVIANDICKTTGNACVTVDQNGVEHAQCIDNKVN